MSSEFHSFSGLAVNYDKTGVMRMGSIRYTDARFYTTFPLIWSDGPVKVLGVEIYDTWQKTVDNGYNDILMKVANVFKIWNNRSLTPVRKIQVVNTLANSQFLYKLQVLSSPGVDFEISYRKLVTRFIWDDKKTKILHKRLMASYSNGGLHCVIWK